MSQYYSALPPSKIHSSQAISAEDALEHLSAYISAAESDSSLQPNAILTEAGPTAAVSSGGGGGSLVMHNLLRVQAALRGEHLDPLPKRGRNATPDADAAAVVPETPPTTTAQRTMEKRAGDGDGGDDGKVGDWQDPESFEQQQEDVEGEVGDRMTGVVQGSEAVANKVAAEKQMDKEARKKAKKERGKKEKKDRERARQDAATA